MARPFGSGPGKHGCSRAPDSWLPTPLEIPNKVSPSRSLPTVTPLSSAAIAITMSLAPLGFGHELPDCGSSSRNWSRPREGTRNKVFPSVSLQTGTPRPLAGRTMTIKPAPHGFGAPQGAVLLRLPHQLVGRPVRLRRGRGELVEVDPGGLLRVGLRRAW